MIAAHCGSTLSQMGETERQNARLGEAQCRRVTAQTKAECSLNGGCVKPASSGRLSHSTLSSFSGVTCAGLGIMLSDFTIGVKCAFKVRKLKIGYLFAHLPLEAI
ncbi:uncharacterized [Tachysurus ichikawai]